LIGRESSNVDEVLVVRLDHLQLSQPAIRERDRALVPAQPLCQIDRVAHLEAVHET
jgi:hypothetical protein